MPWPRLTLALAMLAILGLLGLAANAGLGAALDHGAIDALALRRGQSPDGAIGLMQAISWLMGGSQRIALSLAAALLLWRLAGVAFALAMVVVPLLVNQASSWLKLELARPRPGIVPHLEDIGTSLSYPSGHAASAAAFYLLFALAMPERWRKTALWLAGAMILLTGLSRIMLGVHYPSDVLGGWMLGGALALIGAQLAET